MLGPIRYIACAAAAALPLSAASAQQQPVTMMAGKTIVTVGGGVQLLSLPDINFTFLADDNGAAFVPRRTATSTTTAA